MKLYAESSAVLSWLLEEGPGGEAGGLLSRAGQVFTSDLTLIECRRVLVRQMAAETISKRAAAGREAALDRAASHWATLRITGEIAARSGRAFPAEPVRALDAIHLASALAVAARTPDLSVLSLDERVRKNASALGLPVLP